MTAKKKKLPEGVRQLPNGRYQARYPVTTNGVTKQVSAGTFATISDAKDARAVAMVKLRNGGWVDPAGPKTLYATWAVQWEDLVGGNTKTASFMRSRIVPWWGERRLGEITTIDVQRWVNLLEGDNLAPATVRALYATFRKTITDAVEYDVLAKAPSWRTIKLPAAMKIERSELSVEAIAKLEAAAPPRFRAMIHLAAWAGLRWQECAALQWDCVDLEAGVVHIRRAVKVDGTLGAPKNGKDRFVPLAAPTVEVLRQHRRDFGSADLLFPNADGHLLDGGNFRSGVWRPLVKKAGLTGPLGFHQLRHAFAGHMNKIGMDIQTMSSHLGHHKPSFTADMYGWRRADHAAASREWIEKAMGQ